MQLPQPRIGPIRVIQPLLNGAADVLEFPVDRGDLLSGVRPAAGGGLPDLAQLLVDRSRELLRVRAEIEYSPQAAKDFRFDLCLRHVHTSAAARSEEHTSELQ